MFTATYSIVLNVCALAYIHVPLIGFFFVTSVFFLPAQQGRGQKPVRRGSRNGHFVDTTPRTHPTSKGVHNAQLATISSCSRHRRSTSSSPWGKRGIEREGERARETKSRMV